MLLISLLFCYSLSGQSNDAIDPALLENIYEELAEIAESQDLDLTSFIEEFEVFRSYPININKADFELLSQLQFLTPLEVEAILDHRTQYGDFLALEELQAIPILDESKIKYLRYVCKTTPPLITDFSSIIKEGRHNIFIKYKRVLEEQKGYIKDQEGNSKYLGSPNHYYLRYRFNALNKVRAGITMENDPGEPFFDQYNKQGFDYYSAFISVNDLSRYIPKIILGDYSLNLGQGLIVHNSFGAGKSTNTINIKKNSNTFRPYSSVNESQFNRGAAITFSPSDFISFSPFVSFRKIDGLINSDTIENEVFQNFSSISVDGLHQTLGDINKKNKIDLLQYGGNLKFKILKTNLSFNHLSYLFSTPIQSGNQLYKKYRFEGDQLDITSVDFNTRIKNINMFGELAKSHQGGMATTISSIISLDRHLDFSLSYRNFDKDYKNIEGNTLSEATLPINEQGIYIGFESKINTSWKINAYYDFWKNPWLKFNADAPSNGKEFLFRVEYLKRKKQLCYLQYRYEQKSINSSIDSKAIPSLTYRHQHRLRLHFAHKINNDIELRSRIELSKSKKDFATKSGYLIYQDFLYQPRFSPILIKTRFSVFNIDHFDSRIYAYENDLLYEFYIPFFQGRGTRSYVNLRYKINHRFTWEFKLARTVLYNSSTIGSGNNTINDNQRTEFKTQVKISF